MPFIYIKECMNGRKHYSYSVVILSLTMWKSLISLCALFICGILHSNTAAITQDFYWRDYIPGDIPCDAIYGAAGKYIGQVNYDGNLVTTIYTYNNEAVFELYGKKTVTKNIKILCSHRKNRFSWVQVDFNNSTGAQLENIVRGGYQDYQDHDLFIGKIYHEDEWKIGKVVANVSHPDKGIWVWTKEGNSARYYQFQILKYDSTSYECPKA